MLALDATFADEGDARDLLPFALLAGALAALRTEYTAMALAFIVSAWWLGRRDLRRALALSGGLAVVVLPYAISRTRAWHSVAAAARAIVEPAHHVLLHVALFVAITAAVTPLALLLVRGLPGRAPRVHAVACALGVAGVTAFGERPFAVQLYWPIAIAVFVAFAVAVAAAPKQELGSLALVVALFACVLVRDGQVASGYDRSWRFRVYELFADVAYARQASPEGGAYTRVLEPVPTGDVVAVWVARPELLDYGRVRVIDLRAPRAARDRSALDRLVAASGARWLLLEDDIPPALDTLATSHRIAIAVDGARLVDLR
jgi:hypothetical protein